MAKARTPVGGRNIAGIAKQAAKPAGSSARTKQGADVKQLTPGPSMLRQRQTVVGGGGVNVNSQPFK